MGSFATPPIAHAFAALHHLEALEEWHQNQNAAIDEELPDLADALLIVRRYVEGHQVLEQRQCNQWNFVEP